MHINLHLHAHIVIYARTLARTHARKNAQYACTIAQIEKLTFVAQTQINAPTFV